MTQNNNNTSASTKFQYAQIFNRSAFVTGLLQGPDMATQLALWILHTGEEMLYMSCQSTLSKSILHILEVQLKERVVDLASKRVC